MTAPATSQAASVNVANWMKALDCYFYPVELRTYKNGTPGFFNHNVQGSRPSTVAFERRFRRLGPTDLDAWWEVVYWKLYGQGARPRIWVDELQTRAVASVLTAGTAWQKCAEFRRDFEKSLQSARSVLQQLNALFFKSSSIAITWTFVAFSDRKRSFPMVDRWISNWVFDNFSEFSKRNAVGSSYLVKPKKRFDDTGTLSISDYDFIRGWVLWCRAMAAGLTAMSGSTWTARDVEMAVYRAADSRRPPIKLRPIRQ
jgi:hypothetical protein